jgi:ornithine cyclodeaminase/alanine dehydrogenase-like protein (mu-crystallin family)
MILYLKEADVRRFLTMHDAIDLVEDAARALGEGHANNCPRQRPRTDSTMMHVLPAAYGGADAMGLKAYTAGKRGTAFYYLLFNAEGLLLALIEANWLGAMRTGAASAVATRYMSREDSATLGIIGTGHQARTQLEAVMHVRNFTRIRAWSRTSARLDPFITNMSEKLGKTIEPAASAEECVADADVIITMTTSTEPVLKGAWISAGAHLNVAGSNHIHRREVDGEAIQRSGIVAVEDLAQAKVEAGDLKIASDERMFNWDRAVLLSDIVAGKTPGRHDPHEITMFKSIGIGLWDVVAARHVYDRARAEHAGVELPVEEPLRERSAR